MRSGGGIPPAAASLLLLVLLAGCAGGPEPEAMIWKPFRPGALEEARQEGIPVILDFYADWCVPCLEMERYTFSDPGVIEASRGFANLRLDLSAVESFDGNLPAEATVLVERFRVMGLPTMVFLDSGGEEVPEARVTGYLDPEEFLPRMALARPAG